MDTLLTIILGVAVIAAIFGIQWLFGRETKDDKGKISEHPDKSNCDKNTIQMTEEEKNFLRLFKLISGVAPVAVRELFDRYFPPSSLLFILKRDENRLKNLHYQKRLTIKQMSLLFPSLGQSTSGDFDVTLMICLLRNLTNIAAPMAGFDKLPQFSEISEGSDLARVKFYRNMMAHAEKDTITTPVFNSIWNEIKEALIRLGGTKFKSVCDNLNNMKIQKDEIIELRQSLDDFKTEITNQMQTILSKTDNIQVDIGEIKQEFTTISADQTQLNTSIQDIISEKESVQKSIHTMLSEYQQLRQDHTEADCKMKKLSSTTENIQGRMNECRCQGTHELEIEEWEINDEKFVKTSAVDFVIEKLSTCNTITVIGKPGMGKTATIHHVALFLSKTKGYTIIPCSTPSDIKYHYKRKQLQVFVLDDLCGRYVINQNDVEIWAKNLESLKLILSKGYTKFLASCRLQIFKDFQFQRMDFFLPTFCDLSSDMFYLSPVERLQIVKQYLSEETVDEIKPSLDKFEYLPLMCSLFIKRQHTDAETFFNNPFAFYTNELDKLFQQYDRTQCCALFLCVVYNGIISESELCSDENRRQFEQIFDDFGVNRGTSTFYLIQQLDSLTGTYLEKVRQMKGVSLQPAYVTIHDKMFDFLCFYFGDKKQTSVIRHASRRVIRERTQLESLNKEHDEFTIMIREENEDFYFERIFKEGMLGNVRDLIFNSQMKFDSYRLKLVSRLQKLDNNMIRKILTTKEYKSARSMMCMASDGGYVDILDFILGVIDDNEISKPGERYPPLHVACHSGQYSVVKFLLDKGADVNLIDSDGGTALLKACRDGKDNIVELLLDKYINAKVDVQNKYGVTALTVASLMGNCNIARLLIAKGANVNKGNQDGQSPLVKTSRKGHFHACQLLIDHGADVNQTDFDGMTSLMSACQGGHKEIVETLLEHGADLTVTDNKGWTCLTYALRIGYNSIAEILLNHTGRTNTSDSSVIQLVNKIDNIEGRSPLFWACEDSKPYIVELLIRKGANVNQADINGITPLIKARECKRGDIVNILLDNGADSSKTDSQELNAKQMIDKQDQNDKTLDDDKGSNDTIMSESP